MNFENFKFIPKNNTRDNSASLDDLLELVTPKEVDWVIRREGNKAILFKPTFLNREEGWGYTVALSPNNDVVLIRSQENNPTKVLEPMFLKGATGSNKITNEYFDMLLEHIFPNEVHFQCDIIQDNVWKVVIPEEQKEEVKIVFNDLTSPETPTPKKVFSSLADLAESFN